MNNTDTRPQLDFRASPTETAALDAEVVRLTEHMPGLAPFTRNDALHSLLFLGLERAAELRRKR